MEALEFAAARIRSFHQPQAVPGYSLERGQLGLRVEPLHRVGIYIPGGDTLLPVRCAHDDRSLRESPDVNEIIMVTPGAAPETLAAARIAKVDRVFEVGGPQAIAALAYGTRSIPRVDKIVGLGGEWVTAAKRQVFRRMSTSIRSADRRTS